MPIQPREIVRFGVVGVFATLTHFILLYALIERIGLVPSLANGAAFLCAICVTWLGQSRWVFVDHGRTSMPKLLRFAFSLLVGLLANIWIMEFVTERLEMSYRAGFVITCLVLPALTFTINKVWVFRRTLS